MGCSAMEGDCSEVEGAMIFVARTDDWITTVVICLTEKEKSGDHPQMLMHIRMVLCLQLQLSTSLEMYLTFWSIGLKKAASWRTTTVQKWWIFVQIVRGIYG